MEQVNERVTGHDRPEALQGPRPRGHALLAQRRLRRGLASFAESGGLFSQTASPGFIELWSLQSRMAWRLRNEGDRG